MEETSDPRIPVVSLRGITKTFPGCVVANEDVDLDLHAGEVHALLGENGAGKSTLMNILSGMVRPDRGELLFEGKRWNPRTPRQAIERGIGMVHQHFMLIPSHSVAENIALGLKGLPLFLPARKIEGRIREFSARYALDVDPNARVWQLSVGERQRVEIIKVLLRGARVLILDEPTSVLTPDEIDRFFCILGRMKNEGKAIVFITHKLGEVMEVADRITILRKGRVTAHMEASEIRRMGTAARHELAFRMVGREVFLSIGRDRVERGEPILSVKDLRVFGDRGRETVNGVSFSVHRGEVFGVVGVAGNGQRELVEAVTGLRPACGGCVSLHESAGTGTECAYIPEDRLHMGAVPDLTVTDNSILTTYRASPFSKGPFLNIPAIREWGASLASRFNIAASDLNAPARQLSGGNLQRLILARELSRNASLLVAEQPTHGLDVGSTEEIWKYLLDQRRSGAVLLVSGDLSEACELSDRIGVMFKGAMTIVEGPFTEEKGREIGLMMTGLR